jgi:hypothetical protein
MSKVRGILAEARELKCPGDSPATTEKASDSPVKPKIFKGFLGGERDPNTEVDPIFNTTIGRF